MTNNEAVVDTMVERIVARFQPARILLFGSRARGAANRWSDVDLLVRISYLHLMRGLELGIKLFNYSPQAVEARKAD